MSESENVQSLTPEIVVESSCKIVQEFTADQLLSKEIETRGLEYDRDIKNMQTSMAEAEKEVVELNAKLTKEISNTVLEATRDQVKSLEKALSDVGVSMDKKGLCPSASGEISKNGDKIEYSISFVGLHLCASGELPVTDKVKDLGKSKLDSETKVSDLRDTINETRVAKENDIREMKILANKAVRQMASRSAAGKALIQDLVSSVRPALPAPKRKK